MKVKPSSPCINQLRRTSKCSSKTLAILEVRRTFSLSLSMCLPPISSSLSLPLSLSLAHFGHSLSRRVVGPKEVLMSAPNDSVHARKCKYTSAFLCRGAHACSGASRTALHPSACDRAKQRELADILIWGSK
mmetsp:Transcript_51939/g.110380  ORF Transcript_51939/g.110380 Transcript_51939/m.110380 type:complete len:132 (+) Transcript_51939:1718-2113(+)